MAILRRRSKLQKFTVNFILLPEVMTEFDEADRNLSLGQIDYLDCYYIESTAMVGAIESIPEKAILESVSRKEKIIAIGLQTEHNSYRMVVKEKRRELLSIVRCKRMWEPVTMKRRWWLKQQ